MLATAAALHEDELRADLQQHYGIDLDEAMAGAHTAAHVGALVAQLPGDSRVFRAVDPDAAWRLEHVLAATLANTLRMYVWGGSDRKRRGAPPKLLGPSWMTKEGMRALPARVLDIGKLREELEKPRR